MFGKFFLIDDDSDDRELFSEALAAVGPGFFFSYAEDAEEGLKILKDTTKAIPDVIFLDINLPLMSGWQCLTQLKRDVSLRDIPVIMYSTSTHQRDKEIAKDLGAVCLISKPHDYQDMIKLLQVIVADAKAGTLNAYP
jgi:CheY-like chemotaxis protein